MGKTYFNLPTMFNCIHLVVSVEDDELKNMSRKKNQHAYRKSYGAFVTSSAFVRHTAVSRDVYILNVFGELVNLRVESTKRNFFLVHLRLGVIDQLSVRLAV